MPLTGDAKREYQRRKMAEKRAQGKTAETGTNSEGSDFGGEHYWGAVSQAPEGKRICTAFEFQGRMIGGCGKIVPWNGQPLPTNVNSEPDLAQAIIESDRFKEIQSKMPLTKTRG